MMRPEVSPDFSSELKRVVMPLIAIASDASWHPLGTCFVVSVADAKTAIVGTAAHNIEAAERIDSPPSVSANMPSVFRITGSRSVDLRRTELCAGLDCPTGFTLIPIAKAWHINECDIAYGVAIAPPERKSCFSHRMEIDSTPIQENLPVIAVGYSQMEARFSSEPDYTAPRFEVTFRKSLQRRIGKVLRACPQGIGIHSWPGFLVDMPLDSGMSGGVIIEAGADSPVVRGVIGGDISEGEDQRVGSGAQAFCSMLWPTLATAVEIELQRDGSDPVAIERVIELVEHGVIADRGNPMAHFRSQRTEAGQTIWWE